MVSRVDKKPIIYNTTFLRVCRPSIVSNNKSFLRTAIRLAKGHRIPAVDARQLLDDYEDLDHAFRLFGMDEPNFAYFTGENDEEDDESIRFARMCLERNKSYRQLMKSEAFMDEIVKVQSKIFENVSMCYYGIEAVYQAYNRCIWNEVFERGTHVDYSAWALETTKKVMLFQSTYCLIHPTALAAMSQNMAKDVDYRIWAAWDMFKKIETVTLRIGSRRNMIAHAFYSGYNKKSFTASPNIADDFLLPLTGYCQVRGDVTMHMILGVRYLNIGGIMCVLSHDDCINLATLAQCYYRTALYYTKSNGYKGIDVERSCTLIKDMVAHCCRLIDAGKNFSNFIRALHILAQKEFNDSFEAEMGGDLGWEARSVNYAKESKELDSMALTYHNRIMSLAVDKIDRLNVCFMYHALIGDEMVIDDMRTKVKTMNSKVLKADEGEWANFIKFVKAYTLARYMMVFKKKPRCGGNIGKLNDTWAVRCVSGHFTMPPHADWGSVWIEGEFKYTDYADTWHLEAQDVAYVVKDSKGIVSSKYVSDKKIHSELLMAMCDGNILDIFTGSTPTSARARIMDNRPVSEVVLTTAPKAENSKPSWKKRVTFSADCEFRKMQSEYDRNCRRIMSFIRGPSLGVDQCILEKQFCDIGNATSTGLEGSICSHDISAWSESMDRDRKFEFESVLIKMFDRPLMTNIKSDWQKIKAVVTKQGCKDIVKIENGSFQGFDGSASTILHSMILIYCIDTARRKKIMPTEVKTNMATLIDDCIALMLDLHKTSEANAFWAHLKDTYLKLGFEVDELKSVFSRIKAIYLSRRFLCGGEVPADYKIFVKAHSSYEDPLRCSFDIPQDIFGATRGACDANGEPWYIYFTSVLSVLCELAHNHNFLKDIPHAAAAVYALAPVSENGWGFPSIVSWSTNDVTDKRVHFNAIVELAANHQVLPKEFTRGIEVYTKPTAIAVMSLKSQAWRMVSYSNIFTNPFEAIREGPLKPDMLRRNAISDMLREIATAEPWVSLLKWNNSATTNRVRELLIQSGYLHAPTLAALVNCMPDNYRLAMVGKAIGSNSLLNLLPNAQKLILKRRVNKCSANYFKYTYTLFNSCNEEFEPQDFSALNFAERSIMEREEFYAANGVKMTDHTFPDPVATFTVTSAATGSVISPNLSSLRIWDKTKMSANRTSQFISDKGLYVPRRSGRVWEVTCDFARGWDTVSQRVAMGLAILARAEADGHYVEGLLAYFIKSWNEVSNITPADTHLIAIHGSIKRLDANPGSSNHPVITNRNILRGFNNKIKSALDSIPAECARASGSPAHLHDFLAHETAMVCITALMFSTFQYLNVLNYTQSYQIAARQGCYIAESTERMSTNLVANMVAIEIMDGEENYGLLQACPSMVFEVAIPTMKSSWVNMINALIDRDAGAIEEMRHKAANTTLDELLEEINSDTVYYSPAVIVASDPVSRGTFVPADHARVALTPTPESSRAIGDDYTLSVRTSGSGLSRELSYHQPEHVAAATAIRSIVWSRLKSTNSYELSKILYQDPDANYDLLKVATTKDFWRGPLIEVDKVSRKKNLSELVMSALRSLGIPDIHIMASNDVGEVNQSVASFFGAHIRSIVLIIADLVTSVAGRSSGDYSKPFSERVVTNNPAVMNAKIRRDHVSMIIKNNMHALRDRIEKMEAGDEHITHRGDKKIGKNQGRLVELRCRNYVYVSADVKASGEMEINERKFCQCIANAAKHVFAKVKIEDVAPPEPGITFDDGLAYMVTIDNMINERDKGAEAGWNVGMGQIGARLAYDMLSKDANMIMNTKYAVTPAEIAPKIHKRVIITPAEVPKVPQTAKEKPKTKEKAPFNPMTAGLYGDSDDDSDDDIITFGKYATTGTWGSSARLELPIPYWHALYTLLYAGVYTAAKVNQGLGTNLPSSINPAALREAHLEDFTKDDIMTAFPNMDSDYMVSGLVFDPDWLNRDEADAYTTDEIHTIGVGFLL